MYSCGVGEGGGMNVGMGMTPARKGKREGIGSGGWEEDENSTKNGKDNKVNDMDENQMYQGVVQCCSARK